MSFRVLFRCAAEGLVSGGKLVLSGQASWENELPAISQAIFRHARQRITDARLTQEAAAAARASPAEVQETAALAVREARQLMPEARTALADPATADMVKRYLVQIPMQVRRSLARLDDPAGQAAPVDYAIISPEYLLQILPLRLARFHPGFAVPGGLLLTELRDLSPSGEAWEARDPARPDAPARLARFLLHPTLARTLESNAPLLERVIRLGDRPGLTRLFAVHGGKVPWVDSACPPGVPLASLVASWEPLAPETRIARATAVLRRLLQILGPLHRLDPPLVHGGLALGSLAATRSEKGVALTLSDLGVGSVLSRWDLRRERARDAPVVRDRERAGGRHAPLYASAQVKQGADPTPQDDVYSLGVIWFQMVVGDPGADPGADPQAAASNRGLTRKAAALLAACLSPRAEDRAGDAAALGAALDAVLKSATTAQPVRAPTHAPKSPPRPDLTAVTLPGGVELLLAPVPAGSYLRGSPKEEEGRKPDEGPRRSVAISRPFLCGVYPVTQAQWRAVMGSSPARFPGDDRPVEMVSWDEAVEFCRRVSAHTGQRFRLPTEAEWEYACRAGTTTPFSFGETISTDQANYFGEDYYGDGETGEYREQTVAVDSFPPNAFGLHGFHGNVWEWCHDWYDKDAYKDDQGEANPTGPIEGKQRVMRGGSWAEGPAFCRSASRSKWPPGYRVPLIGFRVVADVEAPLTRPAP